jgi:hypothetical protein
MQKNNYYLHIDSFKKRDNDLIKFLRYWNQVYINSISLNATSVCREYTYTFAYTLHISFFLELLT